MTIKVECSNPECRQHYRVRESHLGRKVVCQKCGREFVVSSLREGVSRPPSLREAGKEAAATELAGAPKKVGRFEIRSRVGAGAFGSVFRAYDPLLDREVALKVPHVGSLRAEKDRVRFLREAKAAAALRHPNIVPVYEGGVDDDTYYIASAFIEGQTLEGAIRRRTLSFSRSAQIVRDLAGALEYAHQLGVVHRDVKPANILLDANGEPLLTDFGLARFEESPDRLTLDGTLLGTPAYMSPEQASGTLDRVGPLSDQYSLGVVLYELLRGERPFSGPPALVISQVINEEPSSLRRANPRIARDLETICLQAMSKDPARRYASCEELADDVRRWQDDEPVFARPVGRSERLWRWSRRNPVAAAVSSAALLLLILVTVASIVAFSHTLWALAKANRERARAEDSLERKDETEQELDQVRKQADDAAKQKDEMEAQLRNAECEANLVQEQNAQAPQVVESATTQMTLLGTEVNRLRKLQSELSGKLKEAEGELAEAESELAQTQAFLGAIQDQAEGESGLDAR